MPNASTVYSPIKQTLASLRANQESFANFIAELFDDVATMQQRLVEAHSELQKERDQIAEDRRLLAEERQLPRADDQADSELQAKVAELEQDRSALEEELESVRTRAVSMAETLATQKREMADESARWSAELRQMRRTLDKQAAWITQQTEINGAHAAASQDTVANGQPPFYTQNNNSGQRHPTSFPNAQPGVAARQTDPVVGSILSQFEMLQKDIARRREQASQAHKT
jgi:chromosome segregation ATPase